MKKENDQNCQIPKINQCLSMISSPYHIHYEIHTYDKDEIIMSHGHENDMLYIILNGKVKISRILENGNRSIIHFAKSGDFIGELELLGAEDDPREVIAKTSTTCFGISVFEYRTYLLNDVLFLNHLSKYLASKLLDRTNRMGDGSNYQLIHRLSAFILDAEVNGIYKEKHTEVSEYLNVSYRHLTYTFKRLIDEGTLLKAGNSYSILDRNALTKYAGYVHV